MNNISITLKYRSDNLVVQELMDIFNGWRVWFTLAWNDIKLRYRRSSLGPFWITISMAIRIYFMGFLYGHLFKINLTDYFPFLASGIITWVTTATLLNESNIVFIEAETYLRNMKIPYSNLTLSLILRNIIIFAHNLLAYAPILLFLVLYNEKFNYVNFLLFFPNLILFVINAFFWCSILAILGTRFRDMQLIVDSIIQVIFFMTPIMWPPTLLPEKYLWAVQINPFYHYVSLIRDPLLGQAVSASTYGFVVVFSLVGAFAYYTLMNKCKHKIIFWL